MRRHRSGRRLQRGRPGIVPAAVASTASATPRARRTAPRPERIPPGRRARGRRRRDPARRSLPSRTDVMPSPTQRTQCPRPLIVLYSGGLTVNAKFPLLRSQHPAPARATSRIASDVSRVTKRPSTGSPSPMPTGSLRVRGHQQRRPERAADPLSGLDPPRRRPRPSGAERRSAAQGRAPARPRRHPPDPASSSGKGQHGRDGTHRPPPAAHQPQHHHRLDIITGDGDHRDLPGRGSLATSRPAMGDITAEPRGQRRHHQPGLQRGVAAAPAGGRH